MLKSKQHLRVFLCHSSDDKPKVKVLYKKLVKDGIDAWFDNETLIPGQDWQIEIPRAVKNSHVVIVCLSSHSVTKEGYVQKEIKIALDTADEKPDNTTFIIPIRLEECNVPERISKFHWVDLFLKDGYQKLFKALKTRADSLGMTYRPTFDDLERFSDFLEQVNRSSLTERSVFGGRPIGNSLTFSQDKSSLILTTYKQMISSDEYHRGQGKSQYTFTLESGISILRPLIETGQTNIDLACVHVYNGHSASAYEGSEPFIEEIIETGHLSAKFQVVSGGLYISDLEFRDKQIIKYSSNE